MKFLNAQHGKLAYEHSSGNSGKSVIFLGGFGSNMMGSKVTYLQDFCIKNNISFTRFDYFGHGASDGDIMHGNISAWLDNAQDILFNVSSGTQVIVGSSMGGWIMLLLAKKYPEKIRGLVGIAAAPDFTKDLYDSLSETQKSALHREKYIIKNSENYQYVITESLVNDGMRHTVLKDAINIDKKVILLHGMQDDVVHYTKSIEVANTVSSKNVEVRLIKHGDHNLNDRASLSIISDSISSLLL